MEDWADEVQQIAMGGVTSDDSNLPAVLATCQEAVQSNVSLNRGTTTLRNETSAIFL